jgi:hypothetical protein
MEEDLVLACSGSPVPFKCITMYWKCNQQLKWQIRFSTQIPYVSHYKITFIFDVDIWIRMPVIKKFLGNRHLATPAYPKYFKSGNH